MDGILNSNHKDSYSANECVQSSSSRYTTNLRICCTFYLRINIITVMKSCLNALIGLIRSGCLVRPWGALGVPYCALKPGKVSTLDLF